jgi:hypothetical protein
LRSQAEDQAELAAAKADAKGKAQHLEAACGGVADRIDMITAASRVVARG